MFSTNYRIFSNPWLNDDINYQHQDTSKNKKIRKEKARFLTKKRMEELNKGGNKNEKNNSRNFG